MTDTDQGLLTDDASRPRLRASPAARRLAHRECIELVRVPGTGPDGRITEQDVVRYMGGGRPVTDRSDSAV